MNVMFVFAILAVCLIVGSILFAHCCDGYGERWEMPIAVVLLAVAACFFVWFVLSMSQDVRIARKYKVPVIKVPMPDGTYKQVFAYGDSESGVSDVQKHFGTILPEGAEIQVTEYDQSSYYGITYTGMINKKYEPYIPR